MATTEELLQTILQSLEKVEYIKSEDIPNIDLYMDQVLTFMDRKLRSAVRPQTEDRVLTKTMINNYAKNDLLPPPAPKARRVQIIGDSQVTTHLVFFNVKGIDNNDNFCLIFQLSQHTDLGIRGKSGKHTGGVVIVE